MLKKLRADKEDIKKKPQIEFLDMKSPMSKIKYTVGKINGRSDIAEEKVNEHEGIRIEITQNETEERV